MAEINMGKLSLKEVYKLMIGSIVPRPIAWVSTIDSNNISNLAPFSFFNGVCSNPPTVMFCPSYQPNGNQKDTLANIEATKEFVVNFVTENLTSQMNQTAEGFPPDVNEFEKANLTEAKSQMVKPPRVKESPIQMECKLNQIVYVGEKNTAGAGTIVIGEILHMHIEDKIYNNGKILLDQFKPIGRLAGKSYCKVQDVFEVQRP